MYTTYPQIGTYINLYYIVICKIYNIYYITKTKIYNEIYFNFLVNCYSVLQRLCTYFYFVFRIGTL